MKTIKCLLFVLIFGMCGEAVIAQENVGVERPKGKKALEVGVGFSTYQFNRITFNRFEVKDDGYAIDLKLQHVVYAGNILLAKELSSYFTADFQGSLGVTKQYLSNDLAENKMKYMLMGGLGLQWRLNKYFNSDYIVPYIRVGGNYMYKDFDIHYYNDMGNSSSWGMTNSYNKGGLDRRHSLVISTGFGVNMWLNDKVGIGLQGDYLTLPYKNVANSLQGTVRLMYRFGANTN